MERWMRSGRYIFSDPKDSQRFLNGTNSKSLQMLSWEATWWVVRQHYGAALICPPPPISRRRWLNWTAICTKPPSVRLRSKDCHTLETIPGVSHLWDNSQRRVKFASKLCSSVWIAFQWVTLICRKTSIETDKCSFWKVKDLTVLVKAWLLTLDECQFSGVESSGWCEQRTF